jgi:hypothetical protein
MKPNFTKEEHEAHLLNLASECLKVLELGSNYSMGLVMDEKRPFGNSGHVGLDDTLEHAGVTEYNRNTTTLSEEEQDTWWNYARGLWCDLPKFIRDKCVLERR